MLKLIKYQDELIKTIEEIKKKGKTIGFVPTMGALHEGHLSLIHKSKNQNDITVASIFVNPTQFNNKEDLQRYPRTLDKDVKILDSAGCNIVFAPNSEEIYTMEEIKKPFEFDFKGLDKVMEGKFRPNHFNGVVQVVSKLFELVQPDRAYFGEKDFQQLAIIRLMTKTFGFNIEIVGCPIVREISGLAMSSRNELLSPREREVAAHIYAVLKESTQFMPNTPVEELKQCTIAAVEQKPQLKIEYFEIIDGNTLQNIDNWNSSNYIVGCIAIFCGKIRLIDNICYKYVKSL